MRLSPAERLSLGRYTRHTRVKKDMAYGADTAADGYRAMRDGISSNRPEPMRRWYCNTGSQKTNYGLHKITEEATSLAQ